MRRAATHKPAVAETEVGEFADRAIGFPQHVLADDAAVGRAELDVRRHVGRPQKEQLRPVGGHDGELAADVVGHVDAGGAQPRGGIVVERALRHGDRQHQSASVLRGVAGLGQPFLRRRRDADFAHVAVLGDHDARDAVRARFGDQRRFVLPARRVAHDVAGRAFARRDDVRTAHQHVDAVRPARDVFAAPFERDQEPLDAGAPADRRHVVAELRQQRIVAPAAAEREADLRARSPRR